MPRRKPTTVSEWFANQLWNTSLIWVIGCFGAGIVFYTMTTNTLETHGKDLAALKTSLSEGKKENLTEREKVRDAFLNESKITSAGINELNKQTAVMAATLGSMEKALDKISQRLESGAATFSAPRK